MDDATLTLSRSDDADDLDEDWLSKLSETANARLAALALQGSPTSLCSLLSKVDGRDGL